MEWTRPGTRRHFDFQSKDENGRKRYIITLQITNKAPERNIAIVHIPFEQDGWSMEVPEELRRRVVIEGVTEEVEGHPWKCRTDVASLEGGHKGLLLHSTALGIWGAYLEHGRTATITFEALVTSDEPLVHQTSTLRYFPDLGWLSINDPRLTPSPFYSSNLELEIGHLA